MSLRNPVKYPVKYYSWQDDQAPQLSNADGVIKTILKACLVTGYGSKQGAGWTALFEDAYRIVLRRPLRTGNPPDIKIENGTITGTTVRHRIVAQDNPTGLDDATELSAVNLLARDSKAGSEWHCIVTDFAFLLCYEMGVDNSFSTVPRHYALFVGSAKKLNEADDERFFASTFANIGTNGMATSNSLPLLHSQLNIYDFRAKVNFANKYFLRISADEKSINSDYLAQRILLDKVAEMPFFCSVFTQFASATSNQVNINARPMLRYVNNTATLAQTFPVQLYIPLDYWEL